MAFFYSQYIRLANSSIKVGLNRLTMLAEKLSWLREALPGVEDEDGKVEILLAQKLEFMQFNC